MSNFWQQLNKPIFCLAPMEEVTDVVFREMFSRYSVKEPRNKNQEPILNPFVMFTEFINVDGILHPEGYERLKIDLEYTENQRPIVAQIWGTDPEKFQKAAELMVKLGFDGIDINMGCPQDKEIGIGACAALIRNPELASQIIEATIKGAGSLPVSVKTRLGYSKADEMEGWISHLLKHNIAALTIHARTKQEKSKVPAQWEKIKEAVQIRDKIQEKREKDKTLIIGNGDVKSRNEGLNRIQETGCDGVMIARGAFGNPWIFKLERENPSEGFSLSTPQTSFGAAHPFQGFNSHEVNSTAIKAIKSYSPSVNERLNVMLEHARLFQEKLGAHKSFYIMRKHFKAYASGFDGASELRVKLLETKNLGEAEAIVESYIKTNSLL